jgi:hypothetical protein
VHQIHPQDNTWYALDSLIHPHISPLTTDQDWRTHTAHTQIFLLLQTTHIPGPCLGARPQPPHQAPQNPDTPFDIDTCLPHSMTPVRLTHHTYQDNEAALHPHSPITGPTEPKPKAPSPLLHLPTRPHRPPTKVKIRKLAPKPKPLKGTQTLLRSWLLPRNSP